MSDEPDPELLKRLEAAVLALPRKTREIFMAHRIDGLSYGEIAKITGLSVKRVERHMARAIYGIDRGLHGPPLRWWEKLLGP
jgi:RNA polymerase sigma-70 factor (ECF subfamily)